MDVPPTFPAAPLASGEFENQLRARRLAKRALVVVAVEAVVACFLASRRFHSATAGLAFSIVFITVSIAILGYAVRQARLRIDGDGVRWGWRGTGFRMQKSRIVSAHLYENAVAFEPKKGSLWYLAAADWDRLEAVPAALAEADIPQKRHETNAPMRASLQSYGRVLNGLLWLNMGLGLLGILTGLAV